MLQLNFDRVFKARGINRPFTYLKKNGFSSNYASKLKNNRAKRIDLPEMEKLCLILNCTPNDIYDWIPDSGTHVSDSHPMNLLKRDRITDISKMLNSVPLDKLKDVEDMVRDIIPNVLQND